MKVIRSLAIHTISFLVLLPLAMASSARADGGDLAQVLQALKTLESRVATLESENQQYRRDAASARAEAQALKQKFVRQPGPNIPPQRPPSGSYAMVTKAPVPTIPPTWGGFYAGASFGIASQRAHKDEVNASSSTSTEVSGPFGQTPGLSTQTIVDTELLASSLGGRGPGAMINLHLGYNHMLTDNVLVGAQFEGGLSNMRTRLSGPFSNQSQFVTTSGDTRSSGPIVTVTNASQSTGNTADHLDSRWTMSALLRGGLLADRKDLIYLIGGLSYARFELADQTFGAFGGTIGAGWERKIAPTWTLKAEYRYTRFQDRTLTTSFSSAGTGTITSLPAVAPSVTSTSSASLDTQRFSGLDWQTVMVGVSHYFDAD
jgi:outer membrane immunogenic protein